MTGYIMKAEQLRWSADFLPHLVESKIAAKLRAGRARSHGLFEPVVPQLLFASGADTLSDLLAAGALGKHLLDLSDGLGEGADFLDGLLITE